MIRKVISYKHTDRTWTDPQGCSGYLSNEVHHTIYHIVETTLECGHIEEFRTTGIGASELDCKECDK